MGILGLSFGSKKQSSSTDSTINKIEEGLQTGTESTTGTKTGTSSTSQSGATTSTGQSTSSQQQNQTTSTTGTEKTTSTTSNLDQATKDTLIGAVNQLASQVLGPGGDRQVISNQIEGLDFDVNSYVANTMQAARADASSNLDDTLGQLFSRIGGGEGTNSAASLLANKARNLTASNLAGIEANARKTGAEILQGNLNSSSSALAQSGGAALLPALASVLKGAETTTQGETVIQQLAQLLGQTTGTTQTSEAGTSLAQSQTVSAEDIAQQVASLLSQSSKTTATEASKTKGKSSGGGISLSI